MRIKALLLAAAAALVLCASAGAANLTVDTPGLGNETSANCPSGCKLAVNLTSDTVRAFVISDHPSAERIFRVQHLMDPNNIGPTLPDGRTVIRYIEIRKGAPGARIIGFAGLFHRNGNTKMKLLAFNEDGSTRPVGGFDLNPSATVRLEYELQMASAMGANDGIFRVIKGNNSKEITDWDMFLGGTDGVDQVRFGVTRNPADTISGTVFLDSYESFRTLN